MSTGQATVQQKHCKDSSGQAKSGNEALTTALATTGFRVSLALVHLSTEFRCTDDTRVADVTTRHRLRSSSADQLIVPSHRLSTVGARAFPVAGAYIWNGLPADVTSAT